MKIRVAIVDSDTKFVNRLAKVFQQKYADKVSLSIFINKDTMYKGIDESQAKLVLFEQSVKIEEEKLPDGVTAGYLGTVPDVDEIDGFPAICKYQKIEELYKMMLSLYAEGVSDVKLRKSETEAKSVLFTSVQGGSGTSAVAAAYALRRAAEIKIFYLNLEKFGDSSVYFRGDGKLSFSDIIYTLKSRKGNLAIKLESAVQTDPSGVDFFNSCRNAYDMSELTDAETATLLQEISHAGKYQEIVVDLSGDLTDRMVMLMEYVDKIVYVSDGSLIGNGKFERFCETIRVMEQRQNINILDKICLLYNRFSSKNGIQLEAAAVPVIGGIHRFGGLDGKELSKEIAGMDALGRI
jgi:cellulose biosynthesis protein BcsQ